MIRVSFVDGQLDGYTDDFAPDEMVELSPMSIGTVLANGDTGLDIYEVQPRNSDGIYVWQRTRQAAMSNGGE